MLSARNLSIRTVRLAVVAAVLAAVASVLGVYSPAAAQSPTASDFEIGVCYLGTAGYDTQQGLFWLTIVEPYSSADVSQNQMSNSEPVPLLGPDIEDWAEDSNGAGVIHWGAIRSLGSEPITWTITMNGQTKTATLAVQDSIVGGDNPPCPADLAAIKTNDVNGDATAGVPFNWTITVTNNGPFPAFFGTEQDILQDAVPDAFTIIDIDAHSTGPSVTDFDCWHDDANLVWCDTNSPITIDPEASVSVTFLVLANAIGSYTNPSIHDGCVADPGQVIGEGLDDTTEVQNRNDNYCLDAVRVSEGPIGTVTPPPGTFTPPPDFTVILPTKTPTRTATPSPSATTTTTETPSETATSTRTATASSTASPSKTTTTTATATKTATGTSSTNRTATPKAPVAGTGTGGDSRPSGLIILLGAIAFASVLTSTGWFAVKRR